MNGQTETRKTGLVQGRLALVLILAILVIDQVIKIQVKTNMYLHESIRITDWFYILFTENPGMAFGWEFFDKLFLTLFRICAVAALSYYLCKVIRKGVPTGFVVCLALVIAGAAGNIIDCVFYGLIFNNPPPPFVAHFVPFGTGYESVLHGRVVDMFYFPIIDTVWPEWMPFVGGNHFVFFSPIFNFADAAISCGIIAMLIFYHKRLAQETQEK